VSGVHEIDAAIEIHGEPPLNYYLQIYDGSPQNADPRTVSGQYFGIQTTPDGLGIFSCFGNGDLNNVSAPQGSHVESGVEENSQFVSIRRRRGSKLPPGQHRIRMVREKSEVEGASVFDRFHLYTKAPDQAVPVEVGSIRYKRADPAVAVTLKDGGGTWIEYFPINANLTLDAMKRVPKIGVTVVSLTANGGLDPRRAFAAYSPMPNADIYRVDRAGVRFDVGGDSAHCHEQGDLLGHPLSGDFPDTRLRGELA